MHPAIIGALLLPAAIGLGAGLWWRRAPSRARWRNLVGAAPVCGALATQAFLLAGQVWPPVDANLRVWWLTAVAMLAGSVLVAARGLSASERYLMAGTVMLAILVVGYRLINGANPIPSAAALGFLTVSGYGAWTLGRPGQTVWLPAAQFLWVALALAGLAAIAAAPSQALVLASSLVATGCLQLACAGVQGGSRKPPLVGLDAAPFRVGFCAILAGHGAVLGFLTSVNPIALGVVLLILALPRLLTELRVPRRPLSVHLGCLVVATIAWLVAMA